ncbi:hypothetical protein ACJX0J_020677, partial [Zea mays]
MLDTKVFHYSTKATMFLLGPDHTYALFSQLECLPSCLCLVAWVIQIILEDIMSVNVSRDVYGEGVQQTFFVALSSIHNDPLYVAYLFLMQDRARILAMIVYIKTNENQRFMYEPSPLC